MSEDLRVIGPHHQWVADDDLLALTLTLEKTERALAEIGVALRRAEHWEEVGVDGIIVSTSWPDIVPVRHRVDRVSFEAGRIRQALQRYAEETASQEWARTRALEQSRDWIAALIALTFGYRSPGEQEDRWDAATAARALLPAGWSPDNPLVTEKTGVMIVTAPRGVSDRVDRIPDASEPPIRIERFWNDGAWYTEVYISGTRDLSVGTSSEPFDMESNIALVAGISASSLLAVTAAMSKAGVKPGDSVTFTGHSQGGLIATRLAESGTYRTTGLLTVGAPTGNTPVTGSYPAVSLVHTDDVVPDLGGAQKPGGTMRVERHSGSVPGDLGGQHSLTSYRETAQLVDDSPAAFTIDRLPEHTGRGRARMFDASRD